MYRLIREGFNKGKSTTQQEKLKLSRKNVEENTNQTIKTQNLESMLDLSAKYK